MKGLGDKKVNKEVLLLRKVSPPPNTRDGDKLTKVQELMLKFNKGPEIIVNKNTHTKFNLNQDNKKKLFSVVEDKFRLEDNQATKTICEEDNETIFEFDKDIVVAVKEDNHVINVGKTSSECTVRQEEGRQPAVQQDKEDVPKNTAAVQSFP